MKKEKDLFGNIIERKATYWVFHDESILSKRWFIIGKMIVKWHKDLFLPPKEQTFNLQRKFHLWAFPDKNGAPYTNIDLALKINDGQLNLLF